MRGSTLSDLSSPDTHYPAEIDSAILVLTPITDQRAPVYVLLDFSRGAVYAPSRPGETSHVKQ